MTGLADLDGRSYGPFELAVEAGRVADFVAATGDAAERWASEAPPMFANVALFAAAPAFLEDPEVVPYTRSLIHSEQTYEWSRAVGIGERLAVAGRIEGVRARGPLNLVTFTIEAGGDAGSWLEGRAVFLMADEAATASDDRPEPTVHERGPTDLLSTLPLPVEGEQLSPLARSASRADLVRYAAATRDWNPIHWDHDAARGAGLPGTVVHGLLMGAWMATAAGRHTEGPHPLRTLRLRFRRPLSPGVAAAVTGRVDGVDDDGADVSLAVEADGERLVTGSARVTR